MKKIDEYINSLYKDVNMEDLDEMKAEMKIHLVETLSELKKEGKSEDESLRIAIDRFGEINEVQNELKKIAYIKNPTIKLISGISLIIFLILGALILISCVNAYNIHGTSLILLIPLYINIKCHKIQKNITLNTHVNWSKEILKLCFLLYILFFVSYKFFPINLQFNFTLDFSADIKLIPFQTVIERINSLNEYGITLSSFIWSLIRSILLYIPIGIMTPIIYDKLKSVRNFLIIAILFCLFTCCINIILIITGLDITNYLFISIDYIILNIIGLLLGYSIYKLYSIKHIK